MEKKRGKPFFVESDQLALTTHDSALQQQQFSVGEGERRKDFSLPPFGLENHLKETPAAFPSFHFSKFKIHHPHVVPPTEEEGGTNQLCSLPFLPSSEDDISRRDSTRLDPLIKLIPDVGCGGVRRAFLEGGTSKRRETTTGGERGGKRKGGSDRQQC